MPIDPRELVGAGIKTVITDDRLCDRCRYNLKGLPRGARCPECGLPIRSRSGTKRFTDNLTQAPIFYLKTLALGLGLTAAACLISIVTNLVGAFAPSISGLHLLAAKGLAAVVWWVGVFIVTAQRPLNETTIRDPLLESNGLRRANRVLQAAWAVAALLFFMELRTGLPLVGYFAQGALVVATLGLVPLALQFSALADWAGDTGASERFKVAAWAMAVFGLAKQVGWLGAATGAMGVLAATIWFWASLIEAIAQGLFLFGLFQLVMNAGWAIANASHAAESARRIADRKEDPTAHRACSECGYSLQGLPPLVRCPECGHLDESVRQSGLVSLGEPRRVAAPTETEVIPLEPERPHPPIRAAPRSVRRQRPAT
jgi:hypothetical protein